MEWSGPRSRDQGAKCPARRGDGPARGLGLAVEEQEVTGRRRKRLAIAPAGRAALEAWLASPTPEAPQFRDIGLLKLAFGSVASPAALANLRADQLAAHGARLGAYERYAAMPLDPHLQATLDLGLRYEQAALDFWRTISMGGPTKSRADRDDHDDPPLSQ